MALFTWNLNYLTGIPEVDADHARLFNLAMALHAALAQGAGKPELRERLASLIDHTRAHFAHEEELLVRHRYPETGAHRAEHESLTGKALQIQREFLTNRNGLTADMLRSVKDWLAIHIETSDRRFADWLGARQQANGTPARSPSEIRPGERQAGAGRSVEKSHPCRKAGILTI